MNPDNECSFHDFLQSQITDTPLSLNSELSNMGGGKFNHREDFDEVIPIEVGHGDKSTSQINDAKKIYAHHVISI